MKKKINLTLACLFASYIINAQSNATNEGIIIESAFSTFYFEYNNSNQRLEVKETQSITYFLTKDNIDLPVYEVYNDNIIINEVKVLYNDKKEKVTLKYDYLSQDDIFFSDQKVAYMTLYRNKKGDRLTIIFEKTHLNLRYFCQLYFNDDFNTTTKSIVLNVPNWLKVNFLEYNFKNVDINKKIELNNKDNSTVYTYVASNIVAYKKEKNAPGPTYYLPHLLVQMQEARLPNGQTETYFKTLANQYNWYKTVLKDLENDKVIIKQKAEEITQKQTKNIDKVKAIFYWVQNNIRYLAFENGIAGFKPDKAHEVIRKRYGDCKGMANVTKELLISLGFDARLCWVGTNYIAHDYSTPSLSVDNHMICALIFEEKVYFLDPTEKYIGFNEYAERIQGRQVLFENKENYVLANVPQTTYAQNYEYEKRELVIDGTTLRGTAMQEWRGEDKSFLLYNINNTKKESRNEELVKFLSNNNANYAITELTTSNLEDYDGKVWANYKVNYANGISAFDKELYLDMDFRKDFESSWFDTAKRKLDYWLPYKYNIVQETEITLPINATIKTLPKNLSINNSYLSMMASYTLSGNKLLYKKTIAIKNPRIPKADFGIWNSGIKKLTEFYNEQIIITLP